MPTFADQRISNSYIIKFMLSKDDELTILRLKSDDPLIFRELYDKYWSTLLDIAYKRTGSISTSEEILQDLFVNIFIKRNELVIHTSFENYLKTSLRNRILSSVRSDIMHKRYLESLKIENTINHSTPEAELKVKELSDKIKKSIDLIPAKARIAYTLSRFDNLSNQQVADQLGISISTVEKHIAKAKAILKEHFGNHSFEIIGPLLIFFLK